MRMTFLILLASSFLFGCVPLKTPVYPPGVTPPETLKPQMIEIPEGKKPATLVWIVSSRREPTSILGFLNQLFEVNPNSRIVVVLDAANLAKLEDSDKAELLKHLYSGHVEFGLTPPGSLPAPLLTDFRGTLERHFGAASNGAAPEKVLTPIGVGRLILEAETLWQSVFPNESRPGLAAPLGLTDTEFWRSSRSGKFPWILAASSSTFTGAGRFRNRNFYFGRAVKSSLEDDQAFNDGGILIFDENFCLNQTQTEEALLKIIQAGLDETANLVFVDLAFWPLGDLDQEPPPSSWSAAHSLSYFWGSPAQFLYWKILAELRNAIADYQNSGRADLAALSQIWSAFYALLDINLVSSLRQGMILSPEGENADREFRANVTTLYQRVSKFSGKKPPFDLLANSLWQSSFSSEGAFSDASSETAGIGTKTSVEFDDLYDSWFGSVDLLKAKVSWDASDFVFDIHLKSSTTTWPTTEIYIDLNNRPYEGKGASLNGGLRLAPADFWEYVFVLSKEGKPSLNRHFPGKALKKIWEGEQVSVLEEGHLSFRAPRSLIRGKDPSRWGWAFALWDDQNATPLDTLSPGEIAQDTLFFNR